MIIHTTECANCKDRTEMKPEEHHGRTVIKCKKCAEARITAFRFVVRAEMECDAGCRSRVPTWEMFSTNEDAPVWHEVSYIDSKGQIGNFPKADPQKRYSFNFCSERCRNKWLTERMSEEEFR